MTIIVAIVWLLLMIFILRFFAVSKPRETERKPKMSNPTINNLDELLEARGFGEKTFEDLQKTTYKFTSAGIRATEEESWEGKDYVDQFGAEHEARLLWKGITIHTIVEGSDAEFSTTLKYPFPLEDFWGAVEDMENEADEAWNEANL